MIASSVLLEYHRIFCNLYIDENTGLITFKKQPVKNHGIFPQYTDDNLSSKNSRLLF